MLNCAANACRDVIERLITLGFYYRELDRFATKSRNLSWIRTANMSPLSRTSEVVKGKKESQSVYRRAIANGIVEVLSVYRSAVLQIEQKLLSDSVPILATVTQGLNKVSGKIYIHMPCLLLNHLSPVVNFLYVKDIILSRRKDIFDLVCR